MTDTGFPPSGELKRCAIVGTAQSWTQCPWSDQTLEVWTLNDGYVLGVPRISRHYDIHPIHQMVFRPKGQRTVNAREVPVGGYLRPEGHLDWLRSRPFPVYLLKADPAAPHTKTFPLQALIDRFAPVWPWRFTRRGDVKPGPDYEVSTPSWMLMHAIAEGYREIHVYGIHLATEWEYLQQRPNFEFLLGYASGQGIKIVLPESAPICRASYRYAFEPKADIPQQIQQQRIDVLKAEGLSLRKKHATLPWWAREQKADVAARLAYLDVEVLDARQELNRALVGA